MARATIALENESWDEDVVSEEDGVKVTTAKVVQGAGGDADGTATTSYAMCYLPDGTASYVGLLRLDGAIAGRKGSVVLRTTGRFDGGVASGVVTVLAATGDLDGLRGDGTFEAPKGPKATLVLDYDG